MLSCQFIAALWSPAGKGLTTWLLFVMFNCVFVTFPCGILDQVWFLNVLIPDLRCLSYLAKTKFLSVKLQIISYPSVGCSKETSQHNKLSSHQRKVQFKIVLTITYVLVEKPVEGRHAFCHPNKKYENPYHAGYFYVLYTSQIFYPSQIPVTLYIRIYLQSGKQHRSRSEAICIKT